MKKIIDSFFAHLRMFLCNALRFFVSRIYYSVYSIASLMPLNNRMIVFESRGDMCDNAYALFDYMWNNGYRDKYRYIWLVEDKKKAKEKQLKGVRYASKKNHCFKPKTFYYLARAKYYFYDHDNLIGNLKRKSNHISFYLWHSINLKAPAKSEIIAENKAIPDYVLSTSNKASEWNSSLLGISVDKFVVLGFPRNDYLFHSSLNKNEVLSRLFGIRQYSKLFIWMPTFRKSDYLSLSEDYFVNETGMPLLHSLEDFSKVNEFLKKTDSIIVLKIHPLQALLPIFKYKFSNIFILYNDDLEKEGMQLYQFICCSDALITDYSSISMDYLLLDRPIIFSLDDYEEYAKSRGFVVQNVIEYFAGYHVFNLSEFISCLQDVIEEKDFYSGERKKIVDLFHGFQDGDSSKRIIEFLHL